RCPEPGRSASAGLHHADAGRPCADSDELWLSGAVSADGPAGILPTRLWPDALRNADDGYAVRPVPRLLILCKSQNEPAPSARLMLADAVGSLFSLGAHSTFKFARKVSYSFCCSCSLVCSFLTASCSCSISVSC